LIQTRWSKIDLTGQVLRAAAQRGGEQWEVVEFPALLPSGEALWPEFWSKESLEATRDEIPRANWECQYQQNPISDITSIIKKEWWKWWEKDDPPKCEFIIQAWDTAHETKTVNDYSACQTWGVWHNEEEKNQSNLILLNAVKKRMEFPDLKKMAFEQYKEWEPDSLIVEKKASGHSLLHEIRATGIPVQEFSPGKGQDKISRLNAVADIVKDGKVWVPRTRWAEDMVDEIAEFPMGEWDDQVDAFTLALKRYRDGGYIRLESDYKDDIQYFKSSRRKAYN
jgi:predicted phage terminase large subunit-like protein